MKANFTSALAMTALAAVSGCATDNVLMMTKTNVGLDIDTKPPTAELTIARRELAIQPIFPDTAEKEEFTGTTEATSAGTKETALPLLGAFGLQGNFLNPRITGQFAGGDAAVNLVQETIDDTVDTDSSLCLKKPAGRYSRVVFKSLAFFDRNDRGKL